MDNQINWTLTLAAIAFVCVGMCQGCAFDALEAVGSVCAPVVHGERSTDPRSTVDLGGCTGTLIAPGVVLSAAHCGSRSVARFGVNPVQSIAIVETVIHPDYRPGEWFADLALHFLAYDSALPVAPLALPVLGSALVQGYGQTETGRPDGLREASVDIVRLVRNHKVLTGSGSDACYGDSGGPLYQNGALVAVVSSGLAGQDCGSGGLYTAPLAFVSWLTENAVSVGIVGDAC